MRAPPDEPGGSQPPRIDPTVVNPQAGSGKGTWLGNYRLLELIGRGAQGEVWRAEQTQPVQRTVAIKLIKAGMEGSGGRQFLARFEAERQALALMNHPAIAKIFAAGSTPEGHPYFVMEYVHGVPITVYCDKHKLSTARRLELFRQVCEGAQHAHQKAVIHRDLKPTNILVTEVDGEPQPKIIDFGIAKAIAQRLTDRTLFTERGHLLGTPEYMSPEQAEADPSAADVDVRADVYALGVILYEMLVGALPFESDTLRRAGMLEICRILREDDPPRPSTKLSTLHEKNAEVASLRQTDLRKLQGELRGELDWITMKALEKDRNRRYQSPHDLGADVQRYLRCEPIVARPPSTVYRVQKFCRRHRTGVAVAASALIALVAFAVIMTIQADRIARERNHARVAARQAQANEIAAYGFNKLRDDPTAAVAYGLTSLEMCEGPKTRELLARAVKRGPLHRELAAVGPYNPRTIDVSPDGKWCAVGWSRDGAITLHSLPDWNHRSVNGEGVQVFQTEFTADSRFLVTLAVGAPSLFIWTVPDLDLVGSVPLKGVSSVHPITALESPGQLVAFARIPGDHSRWLRIAIPEGTVDTLGKSLEVDAYAAAVDPRGRWLAEFAGGRIVLRPFADPSAATIDVGSCETTVSRLDFDEHGRWLAAAERDGRVQLWDVSTEPPKRIRVLAQESGDCRIVFDPYRPRILSLGGFGNGVARLWDLTLPPIARPYGLLDRTHWVHDGCFLPDGSILTIRDGIGIAHWASPDEIPIVLESRTYSQHLPAIAPDGEWLVTTTDTERRYVQVPLSGDVAAAPRILTEPNWSLEALPLLPLNARYMILGSFGQGQMLVLNLESQEIQRTDGFDEHLVANNVQANGTGRRLVVAKRGRDANEPHRLRVYDRYTGAIQDYRRPITGDPHYHPSMAWSFWGDDSLLVLHDDTLRVWDLLSDTEAVLWHGEVENCTFSRDGRGVVVRGADDRLHWVDPWSGESRFIGLWSGGQVWSVAHHDSLIAVSGEWNNVLVYSLRNGQRWLLPADIQLWNVWFGPRGRYLYTRTGDANVWMWPLPLPDDVRTKPKEVVLGDLGDRTNLRAVRDELSDTGYRLAVPGATWPLALERRD